LKIFVFSLEGGYFLGFLIEMLHQNFMGLSCGRGLVLRDVDDLCEAAFGGLSILKILEAVLAGIQLSVLPALGVAGDLLLQIALL